MRKFETISEDCALDTRALCLRRKHSRSRGSHHATSRNPCLYRPRPGWHGRRRPRGQSWSPCESGAAIGSPHRKVHGRPARSPGQSDGNLDPMRENLTPRQTRVRFGSAAACPKGPVGGTDRLASKLRRSQTDSRVEPVSAAARDAGTMNKSGRGKRPRQSIRRPGACRQTVNGIRVARAKGLGHVSAGICTQSVHRQSNSTRRSS